MPRIHWKPRPLLFVRRLHRRLTLPSATDIASGRRYLFSAESALSLKPGASPQASDRIRTSAESAIQRVGLAPNPDRWAED